MNAASPRIVITDCDHDDIGPEQRVFAEAGFDVRLAECKTASDVIEQAREADALINQYAPIDESVLAHLVRCRIVVRYGVGVDTIDVEAADAISLHAPLTEQTRHLIGAEQLRRMKPGAYLVNTSRGGAGGPNGAPASAGRRRDRRGRPRRAGDRTAGGG